MPYATTAELTAYATARGITLKSDLDILLINSSDYIESKDYKGEAVSADSKWPRYNVEVDGYLLDSDTVPEGIKRAEMQTACDIDAGLDPLANVGRAVKSESIGAMSTTYMDSASQTTRLTKINALLRPYLSGGMGEIKRL